ncbi:MAG: zinc-ribbon domain-containing protein [Myxococcales bacterium]|nr:zinc-ribbon domain-containing protein [Myxococcales bacterium]
MFDVSCTGCGHAFPVDERRVPRNGMTMRCPKCQTTFLVRRPESTMALDPSASVPPPAPPVGGPMLVPGGSFDDNAALPIPADLRPELPVPVGRAPVPSANPPADPREPIAAARGVSMGGSAGHLSGAKNTLLVTPDVGASALRPAQTPSMADDIEAEEFDIPLIDEPALPAVAGGADLPAPARGVADLPTPSARADLPAPARGLTDLPAPSGVGLPAPSGVGLPAPSAGLPAPSTAGYPAPSAAGYPAPSTAGYPAPSAAGYPAPSAAGYPAPSAGGYPVPSAGGYPLPSQGALPSPTMVAPPSPVGERESTPSPVALGRIGLERKAFTVGPGGAREVPADVIVPAPLVRPPSPHTPTPRKAVGGHFGELDLDEPTRQGPSPLNALSFEDERLRSMGQTSDLPPRGADADFGAEFDAIPLVPEPPQPEAPVERVSRPKARNTEVKPPSRKTLWLYGSLGAVALIGVAGAALALTEHGAFGHKFIDEQINGPARHTAATQVIRYVDRTLEADTYDRAMAMVRRLDEAIERVPNERELRAYAAYVNGWVALRFGPDPTRVGRARVLLSQLQTAQEEGEVIAYLNLAKAADAMNRGNVREALRLARLDPEGRDLAALAAEFANDTPQWVRLATQARQRRATPRSRYRLARAQLAAGAVADAQRNAEEVLQLEPRHAATRILLARTLTATVEGRARAIELLSPVVQAAEQGAGARPSRRNAPTSANQRALAQAASTGERAEALVVAGQIEFLRDHVSVAQSRFSRALELDPRSSQALVGIGNILYRQGNFTDSLARFRNALTADSNNLDAVVGVVQSSLALNQVSEARGAIESAVRDHSQDGRLQYWLGRTLAASTDQRSLALQAFRRATELQPDNLEAYVSHAELLIQLGRNDAAEQVLNDARLHVPDNAAIHRALAHGRLARGDLAGAETELRTALQRDPDDIRTHFALGDVFRRQSRLVEAEQSLARVAAVDPAYPGLSMMRGQVAEAQGQLPQALSTFREALARDSTNIDLINRVASTLILLGNFGDADQMLRSAVVDHPTNAETQYLMGRAKLGAGNYVDAQHYLDRAIELNPQRAEFLAFDAETNQRNGNFQRALQLAERSIELDPSFPRGYWVRASIRVHQGAAREALTDINRAVELDRVFWDAYATWAEIDDALGNRDAAIRLYEFATQHDSRHGDWYFNLGRLRADDGREDAARSALVQARTLGAGMSPAPTWFVQATRLLADLERARNAAEARRLYIEYLRLVPANSPGYNAVVSSLAELGQR